MKITIKDAYKGITYEVDLSEVQYPWQIREGIRRALSLNGFGEDIIDEVFGIMPDEENSPKNEDPYTKENIVYDYNIKYIKGDAYRDIRECE